MRTRFRAVISAAAVSATLVLANAALAANTGSVSVWHTPQTLASSQSTTIHVRVPETTDPIAAVNIYSGTGYTINMSQAANTQIGTVEAVALSRDNNLTLPLSGSVVTSDPAAAANKAGSAQCTGIPQSQAVWIMNLSVAGNTLAIPVYVNDTTGAPDQPLGGYRMTICLPPPDVPVGTPGRAFQGAQLLDAKLTLLNVFTTPNAGGLIKWETLFTPYNPGVGTVNRVGTFEARAFVPMPIILGIHVKYIKKTNTWKLNGRVTEGGRPVTIKLLRIYRGLSPSKLTARTTTKTQPNGLWSSAGHLQPKRTTYFQIGTAAVERDYTAQGCLNPAIPAFAPAGCASATLSPWTAKSVILKLVPKK
jgi:hypothetical protein